MTILPGEKSATIGLIGAGWRAEAYLRVAKALPERFTITRVMVTNAESAGRIERDWNIPAVIGFDDFLRGASFDYVILAVPRETVLGLATRLAEANIPMLIETPPAADQEALFRVYETLHSAPIEVAEQYQYQPHHAARLSIAKSGLIGDVHLVRAAVAHAFHGISLIRLALGAKFDDVEINASAITDRLSSPRSRDGWTGSVQTVDSKRIVALLRFGENTAIFDFSDPEQYYSPIRSRHISLYGSRGEVNDDRVSYLVGPDGVDHAELYREETGIEGDLEGRYLRRITLGERVLFDNSFAPARLNDDELAIAEVLARTARFAATGEHSYSLAESCQDTYVSLLVNEAAATGEVVRSGQTPWAPR